MSDTTKFIIIMSALFTLAILLCVKVSCVSSKVYNEQYGTSFSCSDFFWAGDQINSQTSTIKIR